MTCWRSLRDAIRGRRNYAISAGMFILLIIITNIIDRSVSVIKKWTGFIPPDWVVALHTSQEEFLELWLPALALLALLQFQHRHTAQETQRVSAMVKKPPGNGGSEQPPGLKWFTEFGYLNRGDMLTSEQHRCSNEKKKFQS
ncbi:hypothetical protein KZ779_00685 [Escherichia coli]|nr:hypothetical protein [Escherichia coli]